MMVMANFGATHAGKEALCPVRAGAIEGVGFLVIDAADIEAFVQVISRSGFVSIEARALGDASADKGSGCRFGLEHGRQ